MTTTTPGTPERKRKNAYHHGNLRQALIDQAVRTIRDHGVDALTLREVGAKLRVSRTALYRHFADKQALLAAVATEGFRELAKALQDAWEAAGRGRAGFEAQGRAYVRFAVARPSHYHVMFGGFVADESCDPALAREGKSAFGALVAALTELQETGHARPEPPEQLALFAWASVHGLARLAIDGQLPGPPAPSIEQLTAFSVARVADALGVRA